MTGIQIIGTGLSGSALVSINHGEAFISQPGAMYRRSSNVHTTLTGKPGGKGGIWSGMGRMMAGEHLFLAQYMTNDGAAGEVGIAPRFPGEVQHIPMPGNTSWKVTPGAYLGSSYGLTLTPEFQGITKSLFGGQGAVFLRADGVGDLLVNSFGRLREVDVVGSINVDNGHLVAFTGGLEYDVGKAGRGLASSYLSAEGFILKFRGNGKMILQSHNPNNFGSAVSVQIGR